MSCSIYLKLAEKILSNARPRTRREIRAFWDEMDFSSEERPHFHRIIQYDIRDVRIRGLENFGRAIQALESSIWFFLKKELYKDIILDTVNIGNDMNTAAAIAGGLAGLYYGEHGMPASWVADIARAEDIRALGGKLNELSPDFSECFGPDPSGTSSDPDVSTTIKPNLTPSRKRKPSGFTAHRNCSICKKRTTLVCSSCRSSSGKEVFVCFKSNNNSCFDSHVRNIHERTNH